MNQIIPSEARATILSTQNQINSLIYSFLALLTGSSIDTYGISKLNLVFGTLFLFSALFIGAARKDIETK